MAENSINIFGNELANLQKKINSHSPLTYREVALMIGNHEETLLKFLSDNDYQQLYSLVHHSDAPMTVGNGASFVPNKARVEGELKLLLDKKDFATLNDIVSKFRLSPSVNYTGNSQLISEMVNAGLLKTDNTGKYYFNVKMS